MASVTQKIDDLISLIASTQEIARTEPQRSNQPSSQPAHTKTEQQVYEIFNAIRDRDPNQPEFLQAVKEVIDSLLPLFEKYPKYIRVLRALCEPERLLQFRVPWTADDGTQKVNRAFRCQFNQTIGPYKGGLRFHPSVNESIIKFLGFEQIFKNALTGLPMGGGKGGSDFNPKHKSNPEILRFCQSFMQELEKIIGPDTDVPAGDIGVGGREIGYLYGEWKRLRRTSVGVLTGKGFGWGGSLIRPEATGYGLVYICSIALKQFGQSITGKRCAISGAGNVAIFAAEKVLEMGGSVVSFSDSGGACIIQNGYSMEEFNALRDIKENKRGRLREFYELIKGKNKNAQFFEREQPWKYVLCDMALPSATQNEIDGEAAAALVRNGCLYVAEGANMPSTPEAIEIFKKKCRFFIPAKAANAGGVAVSGLEMAQNSQRVEWSRKEVDGKLFGIMQHIYDEISRVAHDLGCKGDLQLGANAAGFMKVADGMICQGMVLD